MGLMNTTSKPRATKKVAAAPAATLTDQLRQAMADHSAYRLAKDSGVNVAAILRFKSGERGLTLDSADRLAAVLGLKLTSTKGQP
jgi:plasmid maintenance system antidote protein VapI